MKILLGNLKDNTDELATFLEPRVGAKPKASGSEIEFDDGSMREGVKPRHVKTYVKRYLFQKGQRKNFRVLVHGKELRVVELEREEEEEKPAVVPEIKQEEKPKLEEKEAPKEEAPVPATEQKEAEEKKEEVAKKKPRKKKAQAEAG